MNIIIRSSAMLLLLLTAMLVVLILPEPSLGFGIRIGTDVTCSYASTTSPAKFIIDVTNDQPESDLFGMSVLGSRRSWASIPNAYVELGPGESGNLSFWVHPPSNLPTGKYGLDVQVYSVNNQSVWEERTVYVMIIETHKAGLSDVGIEKSSWLPGETVKLTGTVVNTGSMDLDLILAAAFKNQASRLKEEEERVRLGVDETEEFEFSHQLGPYATPGDYYSVDLIILAKDHEVIINSTSVSFEVQVVDKVVQQQEERKTPLAKFKRITVRNDGNEPVLRKIEANVSKSWSWLVVVTTTEGATKEVMGDQFVYIWTVSLEPGESAEVEFQINYWPLMILAAIILIASTSFAYWFVHAYSHKILTMKVEKHVIQKELADKEHREITIHLNLKNRFPKPMRSCRVKDVVPGIAHLIVPATKKGIIKPHVKKLPEDQGHELEWRLGRLKAGEERVLIYSIKTLLGTLDYFKLPKALVEGKLVTGEPVKGSSQEVAIKGHVE